MKCRKILATILTIILTMLIMAQGTATAATYENIPQEVVCTPHGDLKTQVGFSWITSQNNSDSIVDIIERTGPIPNFDGAMRFNANNGAATAGDREGASWRWHKIIATGLKPGTRYQYRVGDGTNWSDMGEFTTAPETMPEEGFTFLQVNDPQASIEKNFYVWGYAMDQARESFLDYKFILLGGDHVDVAAEADQWEMFFDKAQPVISKAIFAGAVGNHDVRQESYNNDESLLPYRFNYLMQPEATFEYGPYYSFDYGNAHFIILNTDALLVSDEDKDNQVKWLKYDFAKNAKKWNIVMLHRSLYTNGPQYNDTKARNILSELLYDVLGIDIVFGGHDHTYNRTYPILNGAPVTDSAILKNQTVGKMTGVTLWDNPIGTVNQLNNSVGTKFYALKSNDLKWFVPLDAAGGATLYQPNLATYAGVTVTENEIVNSAYYTDGADSTLIERQGIRKTTPKINPPKNVVKTFNEGAKSVTLTWTAPDVQSNQSLKQYVVYDKNNAYEKNWTYFTTETSVTISLGDTNYNDTDFVVKSIGVHSVSDEGSN